MTTTDASPAELDLGALSLIDRLKCFNAKERYWVVRQALGHFQPTDAFVQAAAKAAGVLPPDKSARSTIYLAMDYHLNWLHAALTQYAPSEKSRGEDGIRNLPLEKAHSWLKQASIEPRVGIDQPLSVEDGGDDLVEPAFAESGEQIPSPDMLRYQIENSQEDVDLLLAYLRPDGITQIVLIEAKCTSGFTPQQLQSKAVRLAGILDGRDLTARRVDVKLVLMSPQGLQQPETLKKRIELMRAYCNAPARSADSFVDAAPSAHVKYTGLIPEPTPTTETDNWAWMPLSVTPPDDKGFWVVEFGTGVRDHETEQREQDGKVGKRWHWKNWYLRRRKLAGSKA